MLREIEIGKQYRLNIRPNAEYRCPECDTEVMVPDKEAINGTIVTVLLGLEGILTRDGDGVEGCGKTFTTGAGIYGVTWAGSRLAVPYTWLEPLEENDAGTRN